MAIFTGCPASDNRPRDSDALTPEDSLAGAPTDLEPFLRWSDRKLRRTPQARPSPSPQLPEALWPVIRLEERLDTAITEVDWRKPEAATSEILTLGPFRSDRPSSKLRVKRPGASSLNTPPLLLTISGFEVQREDVRSIVLEMRVPAEEVDIFWSKAGRLKMPVPGPDRFWRHRISTDGLADWSGPLRRLSLLTAGGPGVVEIRKIEFRGQADIFPEAVGRHRVRIGGEMHQGLYTHLPARLTFPDLELPRSARFQASFALSQADRRAQGAAREPMQVELTVDDGLRRKTRSNTEQFNAGTWTDVSFSFPGFSERRAAISLAITGSKDAVAVVGSPTILEPVENPPLVIVYLIDALAASHVDLYGYDRPTMPRLRELGNQGIWFENAFANSPWTITSVPSLLFGMPPERHGVYFPSAKPPSELVSMAEILRTAGFATASFTTNVNAGPRQGMDRGFDEFFDRIAYSWTPEADRTVPIDEVMNWLEGRRDRPCFLYIHTAEPHSPYEAPPGFKDRFGSSELRGDLAKIARYDEEVLYADAKLGEFVDALRKADRWSQTTLFVTSDHGQEFGEHGSTQHGDNLYSETHRIPLVVTGRGVEPRGRIETPAQLLDILPTILDALALPDPYPLEGESLVPLFRSSSAMAAPDELASRTLFAANTAYRRFGVTESAVVEGTKWKLHYRHHGELKRDSPTSMHFELYDIERDPTEEHDVLAQNPLVARRLIGKLLSFRARWPPVAPSEQEDEIELDAAQLETLRALGYLGGEAH